jgi:penicillin-binding protein 2
MNDGARQRVFVLRVLVLSLIATLLGRLAYLQVLSGATYEQSAQSLNSRVLVDPAPRGQILDDQGRVLATNRYEYVVTVSNATINRQKDKGLAVLTRLSPIIGISVKDLQDKIRLCGPKVPQPCYAGSPYQPVPVKYFEPDDQAALQQALMIQERSELFPGVDIGEQPVRVYPNGALAAHELGYIRPINADQLKSPTYKGYSATELIGQAGLEEQYDRLLRGTPASKTVSVNAAGDVIGTLSQVQPVPGQTLVTNLDGALQQAVENELEQGIKLAQGNGKLGTTASAVVVDTTNGAVIALASAPSFDPNIFVGNLSQAAYAQLSDPNASNPLISRAFSAAYAPGSTFKGSSATAILANGLTTPTATTKCPAQYQVGDQVFHNFEGEASAPLTIIGALERSCDTYFYSFAYDQWLADGDLRATPATQAKPAKEIFANTAKNFGYGSKTGIDLPNESAGILYDRAGLRKYWEATKADFCKGAEIYKTSDPVRAKTDLDQCNAGYQLYGGEAVDFAIGQAAQVLATPLQQAMAYAAIGNGGTVFEPQLAKAFLNPDGSVASVVQPKVNGKLTAAEMGVLPTVMQGLRQVVVGTNGTATGAFQGPVGQLEVAGKTGTADVADKGPLASQPQSWFASVQPASSPRYAVVVMVEHGGQGADVAAKVTANIYKDIYGLDGHAMVFPGGVHPTALPTISATGAITPPTANVPPITPQAPLAPGTPDPLAVQAAQDALAAAAAKASSTPAAGSS